MRVTGDERLLESAQSARAENQILYGSTRRKKLLVESIVVVMCLALVLRFLGGVISGIIGSVAVTMVSTATLLSFPLTVALSVSALIIVIRRGADRYGWFLPRTRNETITFCVKGGRGDILLINGSEGDSYAVSMLKLLSVPSQSVRQRVKGAVSREEQQDGAAVSDERQYQFSHLASLSHSQQRAGLTNKKGEGGASYEIHFNKGLVNASFTISARNIAECESGREQVKASLVSKFPVEVVEENGERLRQSSFMGFLSGRMGDAGDHFERTSFRLSALSDRITHVIATRLQSYVAVVALVGRPEMSAYEQRCQIDQFITGISKMAKNVSPDGNVTRGEEEGKEGIEGVDVSFVVSFRVATPPKYPSDAALREKLRNKPNVKTSLERKRVEVGAMEVEFGHRVGWWKVSTYVIVAGGSPASVELRAEAVASTLASVWSGSHFAPRSVFLPSKEVVANFTKILQRKLLPRRYATEMSSMRLSSLVHLPEEPHPPLTRVMAPTFEAPDPTTLTASCERGCIKFGDVLSSSGMRLYSLTLPLDTFSKHMAVFGESGFGKTSLVLILLSQARSAGSIPFLVLDQKGEYRCLVSESEGTVIYFLPGSRIAPLQINLFDPQADDPESHVKFIFNIIREILFTNRTELTPQMERVLYDVLHMSAGGDWTAFDENLGKYLEVHRDELPQLGATVQGILNRVGLFKRPPLNFVFDCKTSNVNFSYLVEKCVIVDMSELRRRGTPEDVRLFSNIVAKYVSVAALRRGISHGNELRHLFVIDDALDVVPEILGKRTTADVGIIEYMAMLLRATGQGLIVVSQRPNVSENVIANSATKVFFRTVVDSRDVAAWVNLSDEQTTYLKVLPRQEAIISIPQHPSPIRIRVPDVSKILRRKVKDEDIVMNNMLSYPLMYDLQSELEKNSRLETENKKGIEDGVRREERGKARSQVNDQVEQFGKEHKERRSVRNKATDQDGEGDSREQKQISKLTSEGKEAWSKLRTYLRGGVAIDSESVSSILDVSQTVAHRIMLTLRFAGLISVSKIPNYAYGKGFQYLYYSPKKGPYGGGIVGYVRERMHSDLTAREIIVELSPSDVPSADMILQHDHAVIIHLASRGNSRRDLRLADLRERIRQVTQDFTSYRGRQLPEEGKGVIVVTLWSSVAREIRKCISELTGCLCAVSFSKRYANLIGDFVLHRLPIDALAGEDHYGGTQDEVTDGTKDSVTKTERTDYTSVDDVAAGKRDTTVAEKKLARADPIESDVQRIGQRRSGKEAQLGESVLDIVRRLGGVQPNAIAQKLSVSLPRISEVAKRLQEKRLIKVARNLPYLASLSKPNATYYLDSSKQTSLHDTVMNEVWRRNIELGGQSRDFSFKRADKTWHADGLLENTGGCFILEVVAGSYDEHVVEQLLSYRAQVGHRDIKGIIVVVVDRRCLERLQQEVASRKLDVGDGLITMLRSRYEKLQFQSLLLTSDGTSYHRNPTC